MTVRLLMADFRHNPLRPTVSKPHARFEERLGCKSLDHASVLREKTIAGSCSLSGELRRPLAFWLKPAPPFLLELTVWALRRRPNNLIDRWDGRTYRRVLVLKARPVELEVTQFGSPESPRLRVQLAGEKLSAQEKELATKALERLLGLRRDLSEFYHLAAHDPNLGPLAEQFRGVKPPRFPTVFEGLANAVACQQMSLSLGILLLSRLAEQFGTAVKGAGGTVHAFPQPEELSELQPIALRELGFSLQKGRSLIDLARACGSAKCDLENLTELSDQAVMERLLKLRGIGRWSAEYVLLRGLGRLNIYPGDDVGARNNLKRWLNLRKTLDYDGVSRITSRWQPYAGFVYFHMLLDRLAAAGNLGPKNDGQSEDSSDPR